MNKDRYVVSFVPGDLFFSSTCSSETSLERREWPHFHGKPDEKRQNPLNQTLKNSVFKTGKLCFLHTSTRNLGLSGMNMKMKADVRLGMEQRATNILQLWKTRDPREKNGVVLGITIQARPGETDLFMMKKCRSDRFRLRVCLFGVKPSKCYWSIHSQQFLRRQRAMNNNGVFANTSSFYFLQLPTCSQDVSCHPECGQSADHRSSPQTGHELGEIGENDRYWPPDPAEEKKNCCSNSCLSTPKRSLKLAGVVLTRCHWWTSAAGRART